MRERTEFSFRLNGTFIPKINIQRDQAGELEIAVRMLNSAGSQSTNAQTGFWNTETRQLGSFFLCRCGRFPKTRAGIERRRKSLYRFCGSWGCWSDSGYCRGKSWTSTK